MASLAGSRTSFARTEVASYVCCRCVQWEHPKWLIADYLRELWLAKVMVVQRHIVAHGTLASYKSRQMDIDASSFSRIGFVSERTDARNAVPTFLQGKFSLCITWTSQYITRPRFMYGKMWKAAPNKHCTQSMRKIALRQFGKFEVLRPTNGSPRQSWPILTVTVHQIRRLVPHGQTSGVPAVSQLC